MAIRNVLVVGGGIGGLTLATALGQQGIAVEVAEIQPRHEVYGVGLLQPGNALRALNSLGLMEACLAAGFQTDEYRYMEADGAPIASLRLLRIADPERPAINMLPRPALHRILTGAAERAGTRIRMGLSVRAIDDTKDFAEVAFTDGSTGRYDLVVGADGIRSHVRTLLFGAVAPQFTGQGVWRYTSTSHYASCIGGFTADSNCGPRCGWSSNRSSQR